MKQKPEALSFLEELSFTAKKEYVKWITNAKKIETRLDHIEMQ